jgi:hypothetical protein
VKTVLVRYRTAPAEADANEAAVRRVFDELRARGPDEIRYATFRLADGVTFVHLATHESSGDSPLTALPAFQAFVGQLKGRCVEPPVVTELSPVDSYRWFPALSS